MWKCYCVDSGGHVREWKSPLYEHILGFVPDCRNGKLFCLKEFVVVEMLLFSFHCFVLIFI